MQPGQFAPRGEDWIGRELAQLRKELNELRAANVFGLTGIKPKDGGTDLDGFVNINGPLEVNGDSEFNGAISITGAASITGTLSLPAGIIDNDALTNPVVFETAGLSENNFAVPSGGAVYGVANIAVPAGYTKADVLCMVVAGAVNSTGSSDFIYASASINGSSGGETPQIANAGGYASAAANGIRSLTGLSGGFITVGTRVRAAGNWAAHAASIVNTNAFVYFRR